MSGRNWLLPRPRTVLIAAAALVLSGCAGAMAEPDPTVTKTVQDRVTITATPNSESTPQPASTQTSQGYPPDDGRCWGVLKWRGSLAATPAGLPCPPGYGRSGEKPTPLEEEPDVLYVPKQDGATETFTFKPEP